MYRLSSPKQRPHIITNNNDNTIMASTRVVRNNYLLAKVVSVNQIALVLTLPEQLSSSAVLEGFVLLDVEGSC
jgi:hypothetical protein